MDGEDGITTILPNVDGSAVHVGDMSMVITPTPVATVLSVDGLTKLVISTEPCKQCYNYSHTTFMYISVVWEIVFIGVNNICQSSL